MAAWPAEPGIKGPGRTPQMSHIWLNHHETRLQNGLKTSPLSRPFWKKCVQVSQVSVTTSWDFKRLPCVQQMFGRNQVCPKLLDFWGFRWRFVAFWTRVSTRLLWRSGGNQTYTTGRAWKSQQLVDGTPGLFQKNIATKQTTCIGDQSTKRPSDQATKRQNHQQSIKSIKSTNPSIKSNQVKSSQNRINPINKSNPTILIKFKKSLG